MTPHPQLAPAVSTSSPASRAPNIRPIGRQMIDRCLRDRAITNVLRSDWILPGPTLAISSGHLLGVARTLDPSHSPSIDTEILDATLGTQLATTNGLFRRTIPKALRRQNHKSSIEDPSTSQKLTRTALSDPPRER